MYILDPEMKLLPVTVRVYGASSMLCVVGDIDDVAGVGLDAIAVRLRCLSDLRT